MENQQVMKHFQSSLGEKLFNLFETVFVKSKESLTPCHSNDFKCTDFHKHMKQLKEVLLLHGSGATQTEKRNLPYGDHNILKLADLKDSQITKFIEMVDMVRSLVNQIGLKQTEKFIETVTSLPEKISNLFLENDLQSIFGCMDAMVQQPDQGPMFRFDSIEMDSRLITFYYRDPVQVIQKQLSLVNRSQVFCNPSEVTKKPHPCSSLLGKQGMPYVKCAIDNHPDPNVRWNNTETDNCQSVVLLLQLFSDKSVTSLTQGSVQFYPFHVNVLNLSEDMRKFMILHGYTQTAFLPTKIFKKVQVESGPQWVQDTNVSKIDKLKYLHIVIDKIMSRLKICVFPGFKSRTADNNSLLCHPVLGDYRTDIPEQKDLLSVKHSQVTAAPCAICKVTPVKLSEYGQFPVRQLNESLHAFQMNPDAQTLLANFSPATNIAARLEEDCTETLESLSLHPYPPILFDYPFVSSSGVLNLYLLFTVDPLHILHVGVSKSLKQCSCDRLKATDRTTNTITTTDRKPRTFSAVRSTLLRLLNKFIDDCTINSSDNPLQINLRRDYGKAGLQGFFNHDGVCPLLQACTYKQIDQISPFFGAILDRACGEEEEAPVTKVFTKYTELMQKVCYRENHVWSHAEINHLGVEIADFKREAVRVFGDYQKSRMATLKWHMLDHIPYTISRLGSLHPGDMGLYENSHKHFKIHFRKSSQRKKTAMSETVEKLGEKTASQTVRPTKKIKSLGSFSPTSSIPAIKACLADGKPHAVRPYLSVKLSVLIQSCKDLSTHTLISKSHSSTSSDAQHELRHYLSIIGEDVRERLSFLINELTDQYNFNIHDTQDFSVRFSKSLFLEGIPIPSKDDLDSDGHLFIADKLIESLKKKEKNSECVQMQRIVSASSYYGVDSPRFDSVMVAAPDSEGKPDFTEIWFARVLGIIEISRSIAVRPGTLRCVTHNRKNCDSCNSPLFSTYALLQYYDIVHSDILPYDNVDKSIQCIRLRWSRNHEYEKNMEAGKEFSLSPIGCILGSAPMVSAFGDDQIVTIDSNTRKLAHEKLGPETSWEGRLFYLNRFFKSPEIMH